MRRGMVFGRAVALLGVLTSLALAGPAVAAPAGTVTFAIPSEPPTVDPAIEVAGPGYRVLLQLYEGLLEYRGNTTELGPALAQSWSVAPDGSWIELKLRPNVKFHDGSSLDAETVKASIDRTKAVNRGGAFFLTTLKEVQIVDRMTVRLVASQPSVSLLYGLPKVFITGKAHLADADRGATFFATGGNGTGPYRLTRWEKGQQIVLDHFADYWRGWSGNHVAQVIERVVPAAGTQQLLLERGDAHLVVLASIGSYVPADKAVIGPFDRIFTRIGASDDLAGGRSTFMVEMTEAAAIVHAATEQSLVLMDEVGRGTSTFDGLALAAAIAAQLHDRNRAFTLFATHYFELTEFPARHAQALNVHVSAAESGHDVVFLHEIEAGPASRSYGVQVARLAGMPDRIVRQAGSRAQVLRDFAPYPIVEHYAATDLERFFGLKGTKVVGFAKSGLAQSIYAELKQHRINSPKPPGNSPPPGSPPVPPSGRKAG